MIDIVLLPPKNISRQIGKNVVALNKQIPLALLVDNKKLLPHISLLHLKTSKSNIRKISLEAKNLAAKFHKISLFFGNPYAGSHYFCIAIHKNKRLFALHRNAVKNFASFALGNVGLPETGRTKLQRFYIKKYGAGNILKYFHPHFTLGHAKAKKDLPKILELAGKMKFKNFTAARLAAAKVNKHYQAVKIIKEFKLR